MKSNLLTTLVLVGIVLLPASCTTVTNQAPQPQAQDQATYYGDDYRVWGGPGWYYGIYFSNEGRYRSWHNRHGYRGGHGHHGGGHHGGGHRGGRGHH